MCNTKCRRMVVYITINTARSKCGWAFVIWCAMLINKRWRGESYVRVPEDNKTKHLVVKDRWNKSSPGNPLRTTRGQTIVYSVLARQSNSHPQTSMVSQAEARSEGGGA